MKKEWFMKERTGICEKKLFCTIKLSYSEGIDNFEVFGRKVRFGMKNNSALFYTCSLIEYIGREQKQKRDNVVKLLGRESTGMRTFSIANQLKKPQMISFICAIFLLEPTIMFKKQDMRCLIIGQSVRYMRG